MKTGCENIKKNHTHYHRMDFKEIKDETKNDV